MAAMSQEIVVTLKIEDKWTPLLENLNKALTAILEEIEKEKAKRN